MIALIVSIVHAQSIGNENIPKTGIKIRETVLFHEMETISMSRSQWIFSFYIDLEPFQSILEKTHTNIRNVRNVLYKVLKNYDANIQQIQTKTHISHTWTFFNDKHGKLHTLNLILRPLRNCIITCMNFNQILLTIQKDEKDQ